MCDAPGTFDGDGHPKGASRTTEPASLILIGVGAAMCGLRRVIGSRSAS